MAYQTGELRDDNKNITRTGSWGIKTIYWKLINAISENMRALKEDGITVPFQHTHNAFVKVATTVEVNLNGTQIIDGISCAIDDIILVKNQTDNTKNGLYKVQSGDWVRTNVALITTPLQGAQAGSPYYLNASDTITIGTTPMIYLDMSQIVTYLGGVSRTGNTVQLTETGVASGTYTKLTVDTKGRVTSASFPTTLSDMGIGDAVNTSEVVTTATPNKILKLDANSKLPTSITGDAQTLQGNAPSYFSPSDHKHDSDYLKLTGGNITGTITLGIDPVNPMDSATKHYVDSAIQGLTPKEYCVVATTSTITLSGLQIIDEVSVVAGNRVLVKDQTNKTENGIYIASAGAWTRSPDADTGTELASAFTFIAKGTVNANNGFTQTSDDIVLGTTELNWIWFSGAGQLVTGQGLHKSGNEISVVDSLYNHPSSTTAHTATQIVNVPAGNISATNTQLALNELDTKKASLSGASFTGEVTALNPTLDSQVATKQYVDNKSLMRAIIWR